MLRNPIYLGKMPCAGEVFDGQHEAIVDEKLFDGVQHRLKHPVTRISTFRKRSNAILAGIIKCGTCGATMSPHYASKNGRRWGSYACQTAQRQGSAACPGSRVSQPRIESFVIDKIRAVGKDAKLFKATIAATKKAAEKRAKEIAKELDHLDADVAEATAERKNLLDSLAAAGPGNKAVMERLNEVEAKLQEATQKVSDLRGEQAALESQAIDEADLRKALASFEPVWNELFPAERARIVRLLIEQVRFYAQTGNVEIDFRPCGIRTLAGEATA
jgi:site-specific DNA recombinase